MDKNVNQRHSIIINHPVGQVSDGYHTFDELYEHRIMLFIALGSVFNKETSVYTWKSKKHDDDSEWDGWFIAGIMLPEVLRVPQRMITYHLPSNKWDLCKYFHTLEKAPAWDGHTSNDVLIRLQQYINSPATW